MVIMFVLFFECNSDHRDLHVLTHSYPYRRSSDLLDRLLAEAGESGPTALPNVDPDLAELIASLSEKERRLLRFLANGLSNKDLSDRLSVSTNTVKRSEEHTSELQSLMRISYAVFCLKKKKNTTYKTLSKIA